MHLHSLARVGLPALLLLLLLLLLQLPGTANSIRHSDHHGMPMMCDACMCLWRRATLRLHRCYIGECWY